MNMSKILSIIIPAFNEEATIARVLEEIARVDLSGWHKEIIVVDDGSHDKTSQEIIRWAERMPAGTRIKQLRHEHNKGKGAAVQTGLRAASGDAVVIQDADLEYHPVALPLLLQALQDPRVAAVYGSRNIIRTGRGYWHYVLGVKVLTVLTNMLFGSHLTDVYTGYKLFRLPEIKSCALKTSGFEFEAEVTAQLLKQKYSIKEVAIDYAPRSFKQGKKIRGRDGLIGMWTLLKQRIT